MTTLDHHRDPYDPADRETHRQRMTGNVEAKVRYACEVFGPEHSVFAPDDQPQNRTKVIQDWMQWVTGKEPPTRPRVSTALNAWLRDQGLSNTGTQPVISDQMLADMDAQRETERQTAGPALAVVPESASSADDSADPAASQAPSTHPDEELSGASSWQSPSDTADTDYVRAETKIGRQDGDADTDTEARGVEPTRENVAAPHQVPLPARIAAAPIVTPTQRSRWMPWRKRTNSSAPQGIAAQVQALREHMLYQDDEALDGALSDQELAERRSQAEWERKQQLKAEKYRIKAELKAKKLEIKTNATIKRADASDEVIARKVLASMRRWESPRSKLLSLYKHREWSLRALAGVVAAGMLWSAVNVQHNLAPGGSSDPLYWFSYLIEGMISACLIIIMIGTTKVAEWGVLDSRRQIVLAELALLSLTVGLNTYPYIKSGDWYAVATHAVAPVMIGVALLIHNAASARYGLALVRARDQLRREMSDPAEGSEPRPANRADQQPQGWEYENEIVPAARARNFEWGTPEVDPGTPRRRRAV